MESRDCQKSSWKTHKTICCSADQHEQSLPSQDAIQKNSHEVIEAADLDKVAVGLEKANGLLSVLCHALKAE